MYPGIYNVLPLQGTPVRRKRVLSIRHTRDHGSGTEQYAEEMKTIFQIADARRDAISNESPELVDARRDAIQLREFLPFWFAVSSPLIGVLIGLLGAWVVTWLSA